MPVDSLVAKKLSDGLDVLPVMRALSRNPGLWDEDTFRQDHAASAHKATRSIYLRMPGAIDERAMFYDLTSEPWPAYDEVPEAMVLVKHIAAKVGAVELGRVMIVELAPGGEIDRHVDEGAYAAHFDRIHICLSSDGTSALRVGAGLDSEPQTVQMLPGEAWWFNHTRPHSATNPSDRPRVHLIIDVVSPSLRGMRLDGYSMQPENLSPALWAEMLPLFERHWREIAHYQDIELDPDFHWYLSAQDNGMLRVYTVRRLPDWQVIGYEVALVQRNPHYHGSIQAKQDVLFLAPEYRNGSVGARLITFADDMLRGEGVQVVYHHVKESHNFGKMLERRGYELIERIYGRRLDRNEG